MTAKEASRIRALSQCNFLPGTPQKRFASDMLARMKHDPDMVLTKRQLQYMEVMCWKFRRQIPAELVPKRDPGPMPPKPIAGDAPVMPKHSGRSHSDPTVIEIGDMEVLQAFAASSEPKQYLIDRGRHPAAVIGAILRAERSGLITLVGSNDGRIEHGRMTDRGLAFIGR